VLNFEKSAVAPANRYQFIKTQVAEVNVGYLPKSDLYLLMNPTRHMSVAMLSGHAGAIYFVPEGDFLTWQLSQWALDGFSKQFLGIMQELSCQRVMYVRFDCDGGYITGMSLVQKQQYLDLEEFEPNYIAPEAIAEVLAAV
jgi:hypothetical protein